MAGGGARPASGGAMNRPGGMVPKVTAPTANRPSALPGTAGTRPATLPGDQRPMSMISRPGAGGSGIAQLPATGPRPGGILGPGTRPGAGGGGTQIRPGDIANRPGAGGGGTQIRPGDIANRPGAGGSGTQWRPGDIANRPGAGGSGTQWRPGDNRPDGIRPGWNGGGTAWRPGDSNPPRPGGIFGRPGHIGDNNIVGSGNVNSGNIVNNNFTRNNFAAVSNNGSYGRQGYYGGGSPGYYGNAYGNWYSGSWGGWPSVPGAWAAGATAGWLGAAQSYAYSNPYASAIPDVSPAYNYAQPIPAYTEPSPPVTVVVQSSPAPAATESIPVPGVAAAAPPPSANPPPDAPPEDPKVAEAVPIFDDARSLFRNGDYAGAQAKVEKALGILPQDRVMHEFRALTLFAQARYSEAAATLYAVISAGPGWNWDTLKSFYADPATYTKQLRALEADAKANTQSADDRFVLAYHYLVLGQNDSAARALEQVTKLQPKDQLSAQILAALKPKPAADDRPAAGAE
jgi:tetratricopeptide (TPR) repeat protein